MTNEKINIKLGQALRRNSVFSSISGIALMIFGGNLSSLFGLDGGIILRIIGIVLLIFAVQLRIYSHDEKKQKFMGWYASVNDLLWVLGSIIILVLQPGDISLSGNLLIGSAAILVSFFGYSQMNAIAKEVSSFELSREVNIPSSILWPIISDVEGFANYADGITSTKIISGEQKGMVRRCHDLKEQGWNETCVSWVDGEMYSMEVDTSDYPYPFHKFQGTWSVKSIDEESSLITLRYDYIPKYGIFGKVMTNRMFSKMAEGIINKIIDNYIEEAQKLQIPA